MKMGIINSVSNFDPFRIVSWYKKSDMRVHLYDARKDILLAVKSVIDDGIKRTEIEKEDEKKEVKKEEKKEVKKETEKEEKKEAKKEEKKKKVKKEEKKEVKKDTEKEEKVPKVETTIKW
jgi:hypothetical protein